MPTIKELTSRLKNLQNTKKITSAMKLVAASKLRRSQEAIERTRPYRGELVGVLEELWVAARSAGAGVDDSPWLATRPVKHVTIVVYTSDKGLCGSYNNGLIKQMEKIAGLRPSDAVIDEHPVLSELHRLVAVEKVAATVHFVGKRGHEYLRKHLPQPRFTIGEFFSEAASHPCLPESLKVSELVMQDYVAGKTDAIFLLHNRFESPLSQPPHAAKVLPVTVPETQGKKPRDILFHPDPLTVLSSLVPQYVHFLALSALLENAAGEHGARMTAMDNATRNSKEMIERYTLIKNRMRQAAITRELIEIISGAESLKS